MLIKDSDEIAPNVEIRNKDGQKFPFVKEFDTETKIATFYVKDPNEISNRFLHTTGNIYDHSNDLATCIAHLRGYDAYDKITNEIIH